MFQAIEVSFIDFVKKNANFYSNSSFHYINDFFLPGFTNHCVTLLVLMVLFSLCDILSCFCSTNAGQMASVGITNTWIYDGEKSTSTCQNN